MKKISLVSKITASDFDYLVQNQTNDHDAYFEGDFSSFERCLIIRNRILFVCPKQYMLLILNCNTSTKYMFNGGLAQNRTGIKSLGNFYSIR